jgi:hypothetical protein
VEQELLERVVQLRRLENGVACSLLNFSMGSASFTLVGKASQQARLKLMPSVFAKMQDCKTMISLAALSEIFRRRDARSIVRT